MNILNNISAKELLIRTFITPDVNSILSDFLTIPVHRIYGPDPDSVRFSPFQSGFNITVTLTTCADLRYIADENLLVELVVVTGNGEYIQIGSEEGFELMSFIPPSSPDRDLYTYTFKTNKPNNQTSKKRT